MLAVVAMVLGASARPAHRMAVAIPQPDGTQVTLQLHGDEFYHFSTTTDGYTVMQNSAGYWVYAQSVGGRLVPTSQVAHDAAQRDAAEQALLAVTPRGLTDDLSVADSKRARAAVQGPARASFDFTKFRGLIILVQPSDIEFSMGADANRFYNTIVNQEDMTSVGFGNYGSWTGSVRDYYRDNSMGVFAPEFDIVGPIKVNYKATQIGNYYGQAFRQALNSANAQVDYSKYDGDGNGEVDMVFFLVAGNTAAVEGNENLGYLWPHASSGIGAGTYDGKRISRYACSTELNGPVDYSFIDGIGTICHEFTHVLGFPDLYDANYATDGLAHDPGDWDIMAAGTDLNYGRTPAGYSIFERYTFGFANPQVLNVMGEGAYTLNSLAESNEGFILRTPQNKEYFIMENRQKTSKWDAYLPGHGMLVTRVDSTNTYYWTVNQVNNNASRMYYELLRAGNTSTGALASDPFPGTYGVAALTNTTQPNLKTYSGRACSYIITNIAESNGVISFNLKTPGNEKTLVETFNQIGESTENIYEAQGDIALWRLAQCQSVVVDGTNRAVAMKNPSVLQMQEPIYYNIEQVTFEVNNTSSVAAKIALQYTVDGGKKWNNAKTSTGATSFSVAGNAAITTYWAVELSNMQPTQFRIQMTGGSKTAPMQVDNFTVYYTGEQGQGTTYETGDVNGDGVVDVNDINILINIILERDSADNYDGRAYIAGGTTVSIEDLNMLINIMLTQ